MQQSDFLYEGPGWVQRADLERLEIVELGRLRLLLKRPGYERRDRNDLAGPLPAREPGIQPNAALLGDRRVRVDVVGIEQPIRAVRQLAASRVANLLPLEAQSPGDELSHRDRSPLLVCSRLAGSWREQYVEVLREAADDPVAL